MANEKRLIDANDVLKLLRKAEERMRVVSICGFKAVGIENVIHFIENRPTVDAVEVVRCKDCKHGIWDEENEMWKCVESAEYDSNFGDYIGWVHYHNADYYCADGERREGE